MHRCSHQTMLGLGECFIVFGQHAGGRWGWGRWGMQGLSLTPWCGGVLSLGLVIIIAGGHHYGWAMLELVVIVVVAGGGGVIVVQVVVCIVNVGQCWGGWCH